MPLQVLLSYPKDPVAVAGLPFPLRAAQQAAELKPSRIIWIGVPRGFVQRWRRQLESFEQPQLLCETREEACRHLVSAEPVLELSAEGLPRPGALTGFLKEALRLGGAARWVFEGKIIASYRHGAGRQADIAAQAEDWRPAERNDFARRAEEDLYLSLGKENDGFIARWDRALSGALSRLLLQTPVTPNQITTASLLLGLLGSALIGTGLYAWQAAGAFLLWACCILDGCDGEVARLKLLCSKAGAAYDLAADNAAHLAAFAGIAVGVQRSHPDLALFWPGLALLSGVAASMFSVWRLILRRPEAERGALGLFVERVASRDYVYLVALLVLIGKLHWFLWAAAAGSHLFNAALWVLKAPKSAEPRPLPPARGLS